MSNAERLITSLEQELAREQHLRMELEKQNRELRGKLEKAEAVVEAAKSLARVKGVTGRINAEMTLANELRDYDAKVNADG
jgi:hypothetical protein